MTDRILNRKGAAKIDLLSEEIRDLLNRGQIASVNLTEWLAVDHEVLIKNVLPIEYQPICLHALTLLKQKTAMRSTFAVGQALYEQIKENKDTVLFLSLANHVSDSVRCWAAYLIGLDESMTIEQKLDKIILFAADKHFGVREISWMAIRNDIDKNLDIAITYLNQFIHNSDPNIRRFASESTRPRGVWCKHIDRLKRNPEIALPILIPLRSDPDKYVRDSVANWLNDAGKTCPDFVINICNKWEEESKTKETAYIIKKAMRSIGK